MLAMNSVAHLSFADVRTFIAVVEAGSISRAAHELRLTQPAVTRRMQRLEIAMGGPLVDRGRRPFALTDLGRRAVERCRRLAAASEELASLAAGDARMRECRIGVAHALTEFTLAAPLDEMRRRHPEVVARLSTGWSADLLARAKSGALDAAVILLPEGEAPGCASRRALANERVAVVAQRGRRASSMRDLAEAGWILNPEGCAARAMLGRALARAGLPLRVNVEAYDYELQMSLVARGLGFGLAPERLLARSASRARVSAVPARGLTFPMKIWMVAGESDPQLGRATGALGEALEKRLAAKVVAARKGARRNGSLNRAGGGDAGKR
jgi:DNA-binding transcriptional LysR family regulator